MGNREFVNRKIFLHGNALYIKVLARIWQETFPSDNVNGDLIKDFCICATDYDFVISNSSGLPIATEGEIHNNPQERWEQPSTFLDPFYLVKISGIRYQRRAKLYCVRKGSAVTYVHVV